MRCRDRHRISQSVELLYTFLRRRRRIKPKPARAVPNSASEAGSGTGSGPASDTAEAVMFVLLKVKGVPSDTKVAPIGAARLPPGSRSDTKVPVRVPVPKAAELPPPPV